MAYDPWFEYDGAAAEIFRIEGNVCFAKVPPGFEIRYELYDYCPNGDRRMAITVSPMPPEPCWRCGGSGFMPQEETMNSPVDVPCPACKVPA